MVDSEQGRLAHEAAEFAAGRAHQLRERAEELQQQDPGVVEHDLVDDHKRLEDARDRAERSLLRSADAHDHAARTHEQVAEHLRQRQQQQPDDASAETADRVQQHLRAAEEDRQLAEKDRLLMVERRQQRDADPTSG